MKNFLIITVLTLIVLTNSINIVSAAGNIGDPCCDEFACFNKTYCNTGLSCCYSRPGWLVNDGGKCYDPKVTTCAECPVYNPNHPETKVCPTSSPTCCGDCIDSSKQCCHAYGTLDFHLCNPDEVCCGFYHGRKTCCSSNQLCINDQCVAKPTCPSGDSLCGTSCYNPSQYVCVTQGECTQEATELVCIPHYVLCPLDNPSLCGDACYNEQKYTCTNQGLVPIGSPTGGATQAPTQAPTSSSTPAPTPVPGCVIPSDLKCGTRCYSPSTHVCANASTSFLCPVSFPSLCGADACYSNTQYNCVNGKLQPK